MGLLEFCIAVGSLSIFGLLLGLASDQDRRYRTSIFQSGPSRCLIAHPHTYTDALAEARRLFPDLEPDRIVLETQLEPHGLVRLSEQGWDVTTLLKHGRYRRTTDARDLPVYFVVEGPAICRVVEEEIEEEGSQPSEEERGRADGGDAGTGRAAGEVEQA
ncbi:hypothetical protein JCM10213_008139 [Rhodosporidiobolus nylandii]